MLNVFKIILCSYDKYFNCFYNFTSRNTKKKQTKVEYFIQAFRELLN